MKADVSDVGNIKKKSPAPTSALTLRHYRKLGYLCDVVETFNHFSNTRKDMFGFVDIVAVKEGELLLLQTTSKSNLSSHRKKMRGVEAMGILSRVPGVKVILVGWYKEGSRWKIIEEHMVIQGDRGYICSKCAKRLGAKWPEGHVATMHTGGCPECLLVTGLASVGDYDWPKGSKKPAFDAGRD